MKIKCSFCGTMFDDTNTHCPDCGAPNEAVVRTAKDQPLTIADLQQWYRDRGLPPYETTRFFIGEDYRQPKAFGIYKDSGTGNFVVYKNKADGVRAVRYEGTDEAYAVNEIYMRLKQEILNQKANNINRGSGGGGGGDGAIRSGSSAGRRMSRIFKRFIIAALAVPIMGMLGTLTALGLLAAADDEPKNGYYSYEGTSYYYSKEDYAGEKLNWFRYDSPSGEWDYPVPRDYAAEELRKNKTAKKYYLGKNYKRGYPCGDFSGTVWARDIKQGFYPDEGYYSCGGTEYYHITGVSSSNWYVYDGEWKEAPYSALPEDMRHTSALKGLFLTSKYGADIKASDFSETVFFKDKLMENRLQGGYYSADSDVYYHLGNQSDTRWYHYNTDKWTSCSYDNLPYELRHPSLAQDFYFTPTWDSSVQFTSFENTSFYSDYQREQQSSSSNSNSGSSNYDWNSNDSWDSGGMDWDSDW